jgi:hypothetical protein
MEPMPPRRVGVRVLSDPLGRKRRAPAARLAQGLPKTIWSQKPFGHGNERLSRQRWIGHRRPNHRYLFVGSCVNVAYMSAEHQARKNER